MLYWWFAKQMPFTFFLEKALALFLFKRLFNLHDTKIWGTRQFYKWQQSVCRWCHIRPCTEGQLLVSFTHLVSVQTTAVNAYYKMAGVSPNNCALTVYRHCFNIPIPYRLKIYSGHFGNPFDCLHSRAWKSTWRNCAYRTSYCAHRWLSTLQGCAN